MNKTLLSLCAVTLSVATCAANAAFYFKGALGDTLSTNHFEEKINAFTPAFSGRHNIRELTTANQFTPSFALGVNTKMNNLWGIGLEFDVKKQFPKAEFDVLGSFDESAIGATSTPNYHYEIDNKYKLGLSAVVSLANSFYFKLGPSWLRQEVATTIQDADTLRTFTNTSTNNLLGLTGGAGFIYKVSRNFGLFTEYDYSYYKRKSLGDFTLGAAQFPGAGGTDAHFERRLQTSQSEFHLGFVWSTCLV